MEHDTGSEHPESADRMMAISNHLKSTDVYRKVQKVDPRSATLAELKYVHPEYYVRDIESKCSSGVTILNGGDTIISAESYSVALQAAGGSIKAVEMIFEDKLTNVFCAIRPPGHHAERDLAMGFCLFNNAAIAAKVAQAKFDIDRIIILDWDVHHGNGTQHIFETDPTVHYISLHQFPFYPGTGAKEETGSGDGLGATSNFPLDAGSGDEIYMDIIKNSVSDILMEFNPDFIILSAGFDAHILDPLGNMKISTGCFAEMTGVITDLAAETCKGKLLSILEGGYHFQALSESVELHLMKLKEAGHN